MRKAKQVWTGLAFLLATLSALSQVLVLALQLEQFTMSALQGAPFSHAVHCVHAFSGMQRGGRCLSMAGYEDRSTAGCFLLHAAGCMCGHVHFAALQQVLGKLEMLTSVMPPPLPGGEHSHHLRTHTRNISRVQDSPS